MVFAKVAAPVMAFALAASAVQASKSYSGYYGKKESACYEDGMRAIGAPGYPRVEYLPCCSGKPPRPMGKDATDEYSWGLFCGGTGDVKVTHDCYADGKRAIGAAGYPRVPYKPCCNGKEPKAKEYDWGLFCGEKAPPVEPTVPESEIPTKCAGDAGYPYVPYVECPHGEKCEKAPQYGWGFYCMKTAKDDCYGPGVRAIGAKGYPAIDYLPCCDGSEPKPAAYDWGLFCPGDKKPPTMPPTYTKATHPKHYGYTEAPRGAAYPAPAHTMPPKAMPAYGYPHKMHPPKGGSGPKSPGDSPFGNFPNFGCPKAGPLVQADPEFTSDSGFVVTTNIQIGDCGATAATLSDEDANELLQAICALAEAVDATVECRIHGVSAPADGASFALLALEFAFQNATLGANFVNQIGSLLGNFVGFTFAILGLSASPDA